MDFAFFGGTLVCLCESCGDSPRSKVLATGVALVCISAATEYGMMRLGLAAAESKRAKRNQAAAVASLASSQLSNQQLPNQQLPNQQLPNQQLPNQQPSNSTSPTSSA